jgi:protein ImuB
VNASGVNGGPSSARAPTRSMLLWSPDWPVTAAVRAHELDTSVPLALIDRGLVFACSPAARREGVKRTLRLREAQARCPGLLVLPYEPAVDSRIFEPVVTALEGLMPGVQVMQAGTCAVRVRGPARYYGGERPAALAMIGCLDELGIPGSRVGIADGPFTAHQAARVGREAVHIVPPGESGAFLSPLPVSLLDDAAIARLLLRLGVHTLGDFAALNATDVRDRFGDYGAQLHALASGSDGRGVVPRIPPRELSIGLDFEPPLDRIDQVTFSFRASADLFIEQLVAAKLVCTAIRVEVRSENGETSEREWLHPRSFTAADVVDRVRWQLQGSGEIDSGLRSGIAAMRVVPESVDAIGNHEHGLWGSGPDERIHHGLSRVQSMLGHGAVLTAVVGGGRSLADRQRFTAWGDRPDVAARASRTAASLAQQPWPGRLPTPAPSAVFRVLRPVQLTATDGEAVRIDDRGMLVAPPARFSAQFSAGAGQERAGEEREVVAWAGPWPVDERWWSRDTHRRASRFQVIDSAGSAWLLVLDGDRWWAEARYD